MRPEGNPLDLNNLPDDYSRDGKQHVLDDGSAGYRKKKSGGKEGKDECGKVYECRFCSLKFCKSQALGGHMNRHRQERETETLNRARQLVFSNDNLAAQGHLSCCHPITQPGSGYGHHPPPPGNMGSDPTLPIRFPTRMFSGSSSNFMPPPPPPAAAAAAAAQPPQSFLYASPTRPLSYSPQYVPPPSVAHPTHQAQHGVADHYYIGHVLAGGNASSPSAQYLNYAAASADSSYTCIGAPVGHGFGPNAGRGTAAELAENGGSGAVGGVRGDGSSLH